MKESKSPEEYLSRKLAASAKQRSVFRYETDQAITQKQVEHGDVFDKLPKTLKKSVS